MEIKTGIINRNLILLIIAMSLAGCVSLRKKFIRSGEAEIGRHSPQNNEVITEAMLDKLPEPVKRHFTWCGYVGKPLMTNALITWKDVFLKMSPDKEWVPITCYQFNSVPEPARFDYMKSRFMGFIPFEGSHMFHHGRGSMKIVLAGMFTMVDGKGTAFDHSELVTILSECLFVPSYAFQDYITWIPVDSNSASAVIRHNGIEVSGTFFFNNEGACLRFVTDERYFDNHDGTYKKVKWTAAIGDYSMRDGIRYCTTVSAIWHTDEGDYEYFKGRINQVRFNVNRINF